MAAVSSAAARCSCRLVQCCGEAHGLEGLGRPQPGQQQQQQQQCSSHELADLQTSQSVSTGWLQGFQGMLDMCIELLAYHEQSIILVQSGQL